MPFGGALALDGVGCCGGGDSGSDCSLVIAASCCGTNVDGSAFTVYSSSDGSCSGSVLASGTTSGAVTLPAPGQYDVKIDAGSSYTVRKTTIDTSTIGCTGQTVTISIARASYSVGVGPVTLCPNPLTGATTPVSGITIHLFLDGVDLGLSATTNSLGRASFTLTPSNHVSCQSVLTATADAPPGLTCYPDPLSLPPAGQTVTLGCASSVTIPGGTYPLNPTCCSCTPCIDGLPKTLHYSDADGSFSADCHPCYNDYEWTGSFTRTCSDVITSYNSTFNCYNTGTGTVTEYIHIRTGPGQDTAHWYCSVWKLMRVLPATLCSGASKAYLLADALATSHSDGYWIVYQWGGYVPCNADASVMVSNSLAVPSNYSSQSAIPHPDEDCGGGDVGSGGFGLPLVLTCPVATAFTLTGTV